MRSHPMPMPFGWFQVAWSDEVPAGSSSPMFYFDRHLVAWRGEDGIPHVWDAFCPHLGAHLGGNATIEGDCIRCPMHGWQYDASGACVDVPYSERVNKQAKVRTYPIIERNGALLAWYHPDHAEPSWDVPELKEFGGGAGYSEVFRRHYSLNCHWQEVSETQVDAAHIEAHLIDYQIAMNGGIRPERPMMPQVDSYDTDGPVAAIRITQGFPTPQGVVDGRIDTDVWGPGVAGTWFTGLVDTLLLGCATPTGPGSCELRFSFVVRAVEDVEATTRLGEAFINELHLRTEEDVAMWETKAYVPKPALAIGDGPIMKYRRWCEQFYAEGVVPGREPWVPAEGADAFRTETG